MSVLCVLRMYHHVLSEFCFTLVHILSIGNCLTLPLKVVSLLVWFAQGLFPVVNPSWSAFTDEFIETLRARQSCLSILVAGQPQFTAKPGPVTKAPNTHEGESAKLSWHAVCQSRNSPRDSCVDTVACLALKTPSMSEFFISSSNTSTLSIAHHNL